MCQYFRYSRQSYYKSLKQEEKDCLLEAIVLEMVLKECRLQPRLGGKKLYFMLCDAIHEVDIRFGRDKFLALLRKHNLLVERKRKYCKTTHSWHHFHRYKNCIKDLNIIRYNQVWAADITYLRTGKGFVYLSLITDMYSRKIVGRSLTSSLLIEGCVVALKKALRDNPLIDSLIHHSDRGIQYCSRDYTNILINNEIAISMTEENHCYENAMAERVNGILKDEYLLNRTIKDFSQAEVSCKEAIRLYNTRRPPLALKYKTPEQVHQASPTGHQKITFLTSVRTL